MYSCCMSYITCYETTQMRKNMIQLTTGSSQLDALLGAPTLYSTLTCFSASSAYTMSS